MNAASTATAPVAVMGTDLLLSAAPTAASAMPPAPSSTPEAARPCETRVVSTAVSRSAASGAVRPARTAGSSAEPRQTRMPTPNGSSMDSALMASEPSGKGNPIAGKRAWSPAAMPIPAPRPTAEETAPTTAASASVVLSTWRREAPSARRSAFSRVRWATTMAKVLWIEKIATSRAMPEKTSRRLVKSVRNWPERLSRFSSAACCPVTASTPSGSLDSSRSASCCPLVPSVARTLREAARPGAGMRYFSASARVIPVKVDCAMPLSPPKVARPTIFTLTGSGVRRVVVSPILSLPVSAAPSLRTTSPGARGARPWDRS